MAIIFGIACYAATAFLMDVSMMADACNGLTLCNTSVGAKRLVRLRSKPSLHTQKIGPRDQRGQVILSYGEY